MAGIFAVEVRCGKCRRRFPVWYTCLADRAYARCRCGHEAVINVRRLLATPVSLRRTAEAAKANGVVEYEQGGV